MPVDKPRRGRPPKDMFDGIKINNLHILKPLPPKELKALRERQRQKRIDQDIELLEYQIRAGEKHVNDLIKTYDEMGEFLKNKNCDCCRDKIDKYWKDDVKRDIEIKRALDNYLKFKRMTSSLLKSGVQLKKLDADTIAAMKIKKEEDAEDCKTRVKKEIKDWEMKFKREIKTEVDAKPLLNGVKVKSELNGVKIKKEPDWKFGSKTTVIKKEEDEENEEEEEEEEEKEEEEEF